MKKNGFTLVEILVSITLISVVMLFMTNSLIKLKEIYASSDNDTDLLVYSTVISKIVNEDLEKNKGINSISCTDTQCIMTLTSGDKRKLIINNIPEESGCVKSTIEYDDMDTGEILSINTIIYDSLKDESYKYEKLSYKQNTNDKNLIIITVEVGGNLPSKVNYDFKFYSYKK